MISLKMENTTENVSSVEEDTWSAYSAEGDDEGNQIYQYFSVRQALAGMIITGGILGTVGNCFVVAAVVLSKKLRTTTNVFVVNLAVADILTSLFVPWQAVGLLGGEEWPIPGASWVCAMAAFVIVVTFGCSINSLALIAVNRWVGITKSRVTTRRIYTARKLALMVIFSWAIPLGCALLPVLTDFGELGYEKLYSSCTWVIEESVYYSIFISAMYYPIQLILITVCYTSIFCYVCKTSRRMTRANAPSISEEVCGQGANRAMRRKLWKRQVDVTKNLLYIVLAFVLCLTPYFVTIVFSSDWSRQLVPWAAAILFCNSCVNPFIYATSHPVFKEAFGYMVRCQKIPTSGASHQTRYAATTNTDVPGADTAQTKK
ncbi:allatostatin-A receptor-like [Patiria miniata]|uniref:G-protein coupled receptors family 1 profile domain-containing protein n=1 Tax=Patiria miniata TaxID=46514 RepID=A0A913YXN4_PATMI|nr:allatostatin-A receptor-like [Patiria miniata]